MINTISLVSNSSMKFYPNNTSSSFTCLFDNELNYSDGDYEIALASFQYKKSYYSFRGDEKYSFALFSGNERIHESDVTGNNESVVKIGEIEISPGYYESGDILVKVLNDYIKDKGLEDYYMFLYDKISQKLVLSFPSEDDRWYKVCFSKDLARKTGFYSNETKCYNIHGRGGSSHFAEYTIRLDEIDQLFVSCDLASDLHQVGNRRTPVLSIVPAFNVSFGDNVIFEPKTLIWLPLKRKSFNSAHTYISDAQGRNVPFTSGTSIVRVEIRRKSIFT